MHSLGLANHTVIQLLRRVKCFICTCSPIVSSKTGCVLPLRASILCTEIINSTHMWKIRNFIFVIYSEHKLILGQRIWMDITSSIWKINSPIQLLMKDTRKYSFFCFITHLTSLITLEKIQAGIFPKVIFKLVLKGWIWIIFKVCN